MSGDPSLVVDGLAAQRSSAALLLAIHVYIGSWIKNPSRGTRREGGGAKMACTTSMGGHR